MNDLFYLDQVFPEPDKIFSENFKNAEEILKEGIVILDTNVLLVPFDTNEKNVIDIKSIFLKYKSENRLFIPARVAREFANNRANRIGEVFLQMRQVKDNLNSGFYKINKYPILENTVNYKALQGHFEIIQKSIKAARKHLENLESHIQGWTWNDSVSLVYKEVFTNDIIIEVQKSQQDLEKDLLFRINNKVAPGYKDSKKLDEGIGDLIIWQTILEIARDKNKDVIFITNDQKNDWFYKKDKIGLYPKYELFDEFRRFTNGRSISIINFVKFLELSKASADTIQEIKSSIEVIQEFNANFEDLVEGMQIEHNRFGLGQIVKINKNGYDTTADISFKEIGLKKLLLKYAKIKILNTHINYLLKNTDFDGDPLTYQLLMGKKD